MYAMSCCCTKTFDLCDLVPCDDGDLVLAGTIPADGEYTLELDFLGDLVRKTAMLSLGNTPTFDKADLNENYAYRGRVRGPSGQVVSFTIDGQVYDCFSFTTKRCLTCTPSSSMSSGSSAS